MKKSHKKLNKPPALSKEQVDSVIHLYSSGKIDEAITSIKDLNEEFPNVPLLFNILGACYKAQGLLEASAKMFETAINLKPDYAEAYFNLAVILRGLGKLDSSVEGYKKAIKILPNYPDAHNNLGNSLKDLGNVIDAIESYEWAVAYKSDFFQAFTNLGIAQSLNGQSDLAVESYEKALKINPNFLDAHFNLGIVLKELGNKEKAMNCFENVLKINPEHAEAHRNLGVIKKYIKNDPQIVKMESLLSNNILTNEDKISLNFALAKAYEDLEESDKQFEFLNTGNQLKKDELNYSIEIDQERFSVLKKLFSTRPKILNKSAYKLSSVRPIFILGMPRSGTSLVEQIISSHQEVYGAGELESLSKSIWSVQPQDINDDSYKLSKKSFLSIREEYFKSLQSLNASENVITDKMPANFRYIGFIMSAFPEAKIVHLKRDARATCWSIYKFLFDTGGNGFSFDQKDLASYYALYEDIMNFWHKLYPNQIYDISYEALTTDQEEETRKLLEYCELDWDENCLNFQDNKRAVKTVSSLQVRQKIYQGSSDVWKKYEANLKPLLKGLSSS